VRRQILDAGAPDCRLTGGAGRSEEHAPAGNGARCEDAIRSSSRAESKCQAVPLDTGVCDYWCRKPSPTLSWRGLFLFITASSLFSKPCHLWPAGFGGRAGPRALSGNHPVTGGCGSARKRARLRLLERRIRVVRSCDRIPFEGRFCLRRMSGNAGRGVEENRLIVAKKGVPIGRAWFVRLPSRAMYRHKGADQ